MGKKEHFINMIEEQIEKAYEEEGVEDLPFDYEVPVSLRELDNLICFLKSQEVKEPLEDVVFFVGRPTLESIVYHVLCRKVTFEAMKKDHNIHFMLMKQFNGVMEQDKEGWTLNDQENKNRAELEMK